MNGLLLAAALLVQPLHPDLDAFREARFGMFIHWGLYAQLGGRYQGRSMEAIGEWIQSRYRIPNAEYSLLAKEFNPVKFDADEWARSAKAAGMEYVVFTTKHHEGFSMFATKASDYNVVDATPFGRDVFGELAAACRRHGLKVGIYYSQCLDWHEFDAADVVERRRGNRGSIKPPEPGMDWGNAWDWPDASKKDIRKYLKAKVYPQLKELLTNYGDIFLIWFDTAMGMTEQETRELREYVRSISPKTVVNSRIGFGLGDFGSMGDNQEMSGKSDFARECPITLNDTWGFKWDDHNWKSAARVAEILAQTVSCNANVLLNVGPRPDGAFPEPATKVLADLAAWRTKTGFLIRDTKASPFSGDLPWGWCTVADGNVLQFVVRADWTGDLEVAGIRNRVKACTAPYEQEEGVLRIRLDPPSDAMPRVVRVTLEGPPDIDRRILPQNGVVKLQPSDGVITAGRAVADDKGFIGVDAVKMGGGACAISRNGAFTAWHHPGDRIAWKVAFPKAGRYRVWLRTENTNHSAPWSGERKVRLSVGSASVERTLAADRALPSTVYARAETDFGIVEVPAGESEIVVETLQAGGEAYTHDLTLVTLESASDICYCNPLVLPDAPDPTVWNGGDGWYYSASTAQRVLRSRDLVRWEDTGRWLLEPDEYDRVKALKYQIWAPDVVRVGRKWNLYIAFWNGKRDSKIVAYTSDVPEGPFRDAREITSSKTTGIVDTIDAEVVRDVETGRLWLFFGSVGGIHRVELTTDGLSLAEGAVHEHVAGLKSTNPKSGPHRRHVFEGAYLHRHGDYWYLFASSGEYVNETYALVVGRSKTLTGTFVDRAGRPMREGFAETVLSSGKGDEFYGPGHNGEIFALPSGRTYMFYHCHWTGCEKKSQRPMCLQEIFWTEDGWPRFGNGGKPQKHCMLENAKEYGRK